jgi:hypothetical protein
MSIWHNAPAMLLMYVTFGPPFEGGGAAKAQELRKGLAGNLYLGKLLKQWNFLIFGGK